MIESKKKRTKINDIDITHKDRSSNKNNVQIKNTSFHLQAKSSYKYVKGGPSTFWIFFFYYYWFDLY